MNTPIINLTDPELITDLKLITNINTKINKDKYFQNCSIKPLPQNYIISTNNNNNTIDFNNYWIYIDATSKPYTGFIKPDGHTIKNLNVYIDGNIGLNGGGIVRSDSKNFTIENCNVIVSGNIGDGAGGIVGSKAGNSNTTQSANCYIINCYVSIGFPDGGNIGNGAGGIVGSNAGSGTNGNCCIINCNSYGNISGSNSGGIVGSYAAKDGGKCYIINSYSKEKIKTSASAGGICGSFVAVAVANEKNSLCNISNCYSESDIIKTATATPTNTNGIVGSVSGTGKNNNVCSIVCCFINKEDTTSIDGASINYLKKNLSNIQKTSSNNTNIPGLDNNIKKKIEDGWKNFIVYEKISKYPVLKNRLKTAGFSAIDLKKDGLIAELKEIGFSIAELKKDAFSIAELKMAGFDATELKMAGFNLAALKPELRKAGFSIAELRKAGFDTKELRTAGFGSFEILLSCLFN